MMTDAKPPHHPTLPPGYTHTTDPGHHQDHKKETPRPHTTAAVAHGNSVIDQESRSRAKTMLRFGQRFRSHP